jgi:hypothetical protein
MAGEQWQERQHEDRLPWLETAEEVYAPRRSFWRPVLVGLLAIGVLAVIVFAIRNSGTDHRDDGTGALIQAPPGNYKVKPDDPGGSNVSGEGESAIAASQGRDDAAGALDNAQAPEAPITPQGGRKTASVATTTEVKAALPGGTGPAAGGSVVQLGSFPSDAAARTAWAALSKRFAFLAPLAEEVVEAEVGGRTVHRLRVYAGCPGQAGEVCAKLTAARQPCYIPRD